MKRIAFIGSIVKQKETSQLMALYNESRIFNNENGVKGVFLVSKDIILQVLEGKSEKVAEATYRFRRSKYIDNFSVVLNNNIENPLFKNWPLRFVNKSNSAHCDFIQNLAKILKPKLNIQAKSDRIALDTIFDTSNTVISFPKENTDVENKNDENPVNQNFEGKALSVSGWPKATKIPMTPPLIKTCSLMSSAYIDYNELVDRKIWPTQKELNSFLHILDGLGLLKVADSEPHEEQPVAVAANDRFSSLLRRFIHPPKRQTN